MFGNQFDGLNDKTSWTFSTIVEESTPPKLTSTYPNNGESSISDNLSSLRLNFDERIKTLAGKRVRLFNLDNDELVHEYITDDAATYSSSIRIDLPSNILELSTNYYVLVESGLAQDYFGNVFNEGFENTEVWAFRTQDPESEAPYVNYYEPGIGTINLPINQENIWIQFNEYVKLNDGKSIKLMNYENDQLIHEFITSESDLFYSKSFELPNYLPTSTKIYVLIEEGAFEDRFANQFPGFNSKSDWFFSTENPDGIRPRVASKSPKNQEEDVTSIGFDLALEFLESVKAVDGKNIFLKEKSSGELIIDITVGASEIQTEFTYAIEPISLSSFTEYYIEMEEGAFEDIYGNQSYAITDPDEWYFTTGFNEFEPPTFSALTPANESENVSVYPVEVALTFDQSVSSVSGKSIQLFNAEDELVQELSMSNSNLKSSHVYLFDELILEASSSYYIVVESGAFISEAEIGTPAINQGEWQFETEENDLTPPLLINTNPENEDANVIINTGQLTITFDETVVVNDGAEVSLFNVEDDQLVQTITVPQGEIGTEFSASLGGLLSPSTSYYVLINEGAVSDLFGNEFAGIESNTDWVFETEDAETNAPIISSTTPLNQATEVNFSLSSITIVFNEVVSSVAGKEITLYDQENNSILKTIGLTTSGLKSSHSIDLGEVAFKPLGQYYILIESGSFMDRFGNAFGGLNASDQWSFTLEHPDQVVPEILSLSPENGDTAVPISEISFQIIFTEDVKTIGGHSIRLFEAETDIVVGSFVTAGIDELSNIFSFEFENLELTPNTNYYVLVEEGAFEDSFQNKFLGIVDNSGWKFTSDLPKNDLEVLEMSPNNVELNYSHALLQFSITFNKQVNGVEGKKIKVLNDKGEIIFEHILESTGTQSDQYSFEVPGELLNYETTYHVEIEEEAFIDEFSNVLGPIEDWSFGIEAYPLASISISEAEVFEDENNPIIVTISTDKVVYEDQMVELDISGSGIDSDDYSLESDLISIAGNSSMNSVSLTIQNNAQVEGLEEMNVGFVVLTDGMKANSGAVVLSILEREDDEPVETSIKDQLRKSLQTYPIPVSTLLTIETNDFNLDQINIYNLSGLRIFNIKPNLKTTNTIDIDVTSLSDGLYVLEVITKSGFTERRNIIKRK
ncbi:MAG: Ig-like domain-containing protein [Cyclobacteriaceae bacterium]